MPRRELPLEPDGGALVRFAADLRRLREQAGGPTYRQLSRRAHYSPASLSEAAGGKKLPTLAVLHAYVRACGGDVEEWQARWRALAAELVATEDPDERDGAEAPGPYVGLAAFQADDADRFFGREALVADLLERIRQRRFIGVFGASGSGKSSVLRAGVVASALAHGLSNGGRRQPVVLFTPGPRPMEECAVQVAALLGESPAVLREEFVADPRNLELRIREGLAGQPPEVDLLMVVDQFEEAFTQCRDSQETTLFITALIAAAQSPNSRVRVVIGVRADFYGHCGQYPALVDALRDAQVLIGPMTADELRRAITQPAAGGGCTVETALIARLIADTNGQAGVLPLMSHALLQTWRRRRGNTLTEAGYEAAGGVHQAVARSAEHTYTTLDPARQAVARQLFLRLTTPGEGTEDTKRRLRRDELDHDDADMTAVLHHLARARLIILDEHTVDLAHEALIRVWPRLSDWLNEDRDGLRVHRHLTNATEAWQSLHRDPGGLYRGARLAVAQSWANNNQNALTSREREFLKASLDAQTREHDANFRRTRRLRRLVALLAVVVIVAISATGYAVNAQQVATRQRDTAVAQKVIHDATALYPTNPALALQLALSAYRLDPTLKGSVLSMAATPYTAQLDVGAPEITDMAVSAKGHIMVIPGQTTGLWDITDIHQPRRLATVPINSATVDISEDGRLLATTLNDKTTLWDLTDAHHPHQISSLSTPAHLFSFGKVALTVDGHRGLLVTASGDQVATLWDITDPVHPKQLTAIGNSGVVSVEFSPDGHYLATVDGSDRVAVRIWDVTDPRHPGLVSTLAGQDQLQGKDSIGNVVFSPDGHRIATSSQSGAIRLWEIADPRRPEFVASLSGSLVAFSPDGRFIVGAGDAGTRLWDLTDPHHPGLVGVVARPGDLPVVNIQFDPGGHTLIAASSARTIWFEDFLPFPPPARTFGGAVAFSPDSRALISIDSGLAARWTLADPYDPQQSTSIAIGSPEKAPELPGLPGDSYTVISQNGRMLAHGTPSGIQLWDIADQEHPQAAATIDGNASVADFSPDGTSLALGKYTTNSAGVPAYAQIIIDVTNPRDPREIARLPLSNSFRTAIAPHSAMMAVANYDGTMQLWSIARGEEPRKIGQIPPGSSNFNESNFVFSPRGDILAIADPDDNVQLWQIGDASHPNKISEISLGAEPVRDPARPIAFSSDGSMIATSAGDKSIRVWSIADPSHPEEYATFTGHTDSVATLRFSPDGSKVVSTAFVPIPNDAASYVNGELRVWNLGVESAAAHICKIAYPRITPTEWSHYFTNLSYQPPCPA